jgi:hypothetical protein
MTHKKFAFPYEDLDAALTFHPTGITDIISAAAGTAGIVTNIGAND